MWASRSIVSGRREAGEAGGQGRQEQAGGRPAAGQSCRASGRETATYNSIIRMTRILVTNDDGYRSDGIRALAEALAPLGEVTIVAPVQEASAVGHGLTLRQPLRLDAIGERIFAVDGTPTDCVNLAVTQVFKSLPDLVVSGINKGWNLGDDVTYSGTVAGALEAALLGVPGIAVSVRATRGDYDFGPASDVAATMAEAILRHPLPARTFLNINLPNGRPEGVPRDRPGEAQSRDVGDRAPRSQGSAVLLDRGGGGRVAPTRSIGLPGGARRLRVADAIAPRSHRASCACRGRGAILREGSWGKMTYSRAAPRPERRVKLQMSGRGSAW